MANSQAVVDQSTVAPSVIRTHSRLIPLKVWLFALVIAGITSLPYVLAFVNTPEGWVYSGAPVIPSGTEVDYNSHLAKMWQGSRGQWDYHLLFTHEAHRGIPFLQSFYVALGALASLTDLSLPAMYHLARFALTIGMVLAVWWLAAYYFEHPRERWLALVFATLASGWSWLLLLIAPAQVAAVSPIEFWLLDAFNLLGALSMPHFSAAVILQIVVVLSYEHWSAQGGWRSFGVLTLALALESFVQPYIVVLFGPLLVLMTAYRVFINHKLALKRALWLILSLALHGLLVVYQLVAVNGDPIWTSFSAQNITLSPPVIFYLLGYLPFLLPIAFGLPKLRQRDDRWWLLIAWVLLVALLVYVPLPTQRRYLLGVQTPLAVLAAFGWIHGVLPRIRRGYRPLATGVYVVLAALGMVALLFANLAASLRTNDTAYYSPDAWGAVEWLRENADHPDDLVLTTFNRAGQGGGGRVVAATGMRVFAGHWIETAFLDDKVEQLRRFYDPATADDWRREFLNAVGATYVWYDENSSTFGAWNPGSADILAPVYESESVSLYRVMR